MLENLKYQDIETIALVVCALVFVALEKFSPKHKDLDVKSHLKMDIAAFLLLVISINISRPVAGLLFDAIRIKELGIIADTLTWPFLSNFAWPILFLIFVSIGFTDSCIRMKSFGELTSFTIQLNLCIGCPDSARVLLTCSSMRFLRCW